MFCASTVRMNRVWCTSNHETLKPLVEQFGVPFHYVSHQNVERTAHEDRGAEVLTGYTPEYIVLTKYMRILSPKFIARYPNRMINIHHSFLPASSALNRTIKLTNAMSKSLGLPRTLSPTTSTPDLSSS